MGEKENGDPHGDFVTVTVTSVKKGEEIWNAYSNDGMDPREAFDTYGYHQNTFYPLLIELDKDDPKYRERNKVVKQKTDGYIVIADPREWDMFIHEDYFKDLLMLATASTEPVRSPDNVSKAWKFLDKMITKKLSGYPGSRDDIEEQLKKATKETTKFVLKQVLEEIELLQRIQAGIRKMK